MVAKYTAAAAKSLQLCPTLCDPIDSSPPGSPIPGTLQARTLEWVAISFSEYYSAIKRNAFESVHHLHCVIIRGFISVIFEGSSGFPSEKAMAPHSSTLAWKIPWTEEPGGLQSMGSLRVGHD